MIDKKKQILKRLNEDPLKDGDLVVSKRLLLEFLGEVDSHVENAYIMIFILGGLLATALTLMGWSIFHVFR